MSGRKRIQVDESEWFRTRRQAARLKDVQRALPGMLDDIRRRTHADLERVFGVVEERQRTVEQAVQGLSDRARELESRTQERLRAQARRMAEELRATAGELRRETAEDLAEQEHRLQEEIAAERRERRREVGRLAEEVGELVLDRERAAALAHEAISDARAMHLLVHTAFPADVHPHARRTDSLAEQLDRAAETLGRGRSDAALATAQSVYQGLSDLLQELERHDRERRRDRVRAGELLLHVQHLIKVNAVQDVREAEGEEPTDAVLDVEYWSGGELTRLRAETARLQERVGDEERPPDTGELRDILEHRVPELEQRLAETVERAGRRRQESQMRVNLAGSVVGTLEEITGYELTDGTYSGDDQREAFFAKLVHRNGNEIVVEVAPAGTGGGTAVLRVLSYDRDTTARDELTTRGHEVARGLRDRGIAASDPEAEDGEPDPAYRDFDALRRALPRAATDT
ncbi:hypothetical protein [Streptomyces albireticuli]|uniref:Uncharacterized protein n=1 Tax=Streptomyces albireticuli TaxID=1940 RepID=A0A2A2D935_9ACTN|nr:hypothetical protein [Streptomyces albireticuli]MCD9194386.1 hypothetical protein [Streptomyces albireticuli]PAU47889.1 hypothetical protein CK936_16245 [Streptomyces albireticuli]